MFGQVKWFIRPLCLYIYIYIHLHTYTYTHTPTHIHLHIYTYTYTYTYTHTYTYTYTYTYTHKHTHGYTYIHFSKDHETSTATKSSHAHLFQGAAERIPENKPVHHFLQFFFSFPSDIFHTVLTQDSCLAQYIPSQATIHTHFNTQRMIHYLRSSGALRSRNILPYLLKPNGGPPVIRARSYAKLATIDTEFNKTIYKEISSAKKRIENMLSDRKSYSLVQDKAFHDNLLKDGKFMRENLTLMKKKLFEIETYFLDNLITKPIKFDAGDKPERIYSDLLSPTLAKGGDIMYNLFQNHPNLNHAQVVEKFLLKLLYNEMKPTRLYHIYNDASNNQNFTKNLTLNIMDINNPYEWFPDARKLKRKLIMHMGPTNSGKTYKALKRLETCSKGYFAGPLRLLAREVYDKFQNNNIRCNLVTGEEVIADIDEFGNRAGLTSGTIEMLSTTENYDVVVIDEIQMINDPNRGSAWTNAVLGAKAKEIHLCGEPSVIPLIQKIVSMTGDELEINHYDRLGGLEVDEQPITLRQLRKGDAVVSFSKKNILKLKHTIESSTNFKCGLIYGALPPETRIQEANRFNSGVYDIVIATDAIGMGLNLSINRVVFTTTKKYDGSKDVQLSTSNIKQIAGRAGRYGKTEASVGFVTALNQRDLNVIRECISEPYDIIEKAVLWPPETLWIKYFSMYPRNTSLIQVYERFLRDVKKNAEEIGSSSISLKQELSGNYGRGSKKHANNIFELLSLKDLEIVARFFKEGELDRKGRFNILDQLKIVQSPFPVNPNGMLRTLIPVLFSDLIESVIVRNKIGFFDFVKMPMFLLSNVPIEDQIKKTLSNSNSLHARAAQLVLDINGGDSSSSSVLSSSRYGGGGSRRSNGSKDGKDAVESGYDLPTAQKIMWCTERLAQLEEYHKLLSAFVWLSYRYSQNFIDRESLFKVKEMVEFKIGEMIDDLRVRKLTSPRATKKQTSTSSTTIGISTSTSNTNLTNRT